MKVRLDSIEIYAGTQARQSINDERVDIYAERMTEGDIFPPVVLFHDGSVYYLGDGFHRVLASERNGFIDIDAEVHKGTQQDALWYAIGANKANGQAMTKGDLRHAVALALKTWPDKTQQAIADQVGCSRATVQRTQDELVHLNKLEIPETRTGADGKERPTTYQKKDTLEDIPETQQETTPDEAGEQQEEQEEETQDEKPKRKKPEYAPSSIGLQYAEMAIDSLKQIPKDDCERKEAFELIVKWIKKNR
jgi:hypothetical protein